MIKILRPFISRGYLLMCYSGETPCIAMSENKITHQQIKQFYVLKINDVEKLSYPLQFKMFGKDYLMDFVGLRLFDIVTEEEVVRYEQIYTSAIHFSIIKVANRLHILGRMVKLIGQNDDDSKMEFFDFQVDLQDTDSVFSTLSDVKHWELEDFQGIENPQDIDFLE